MNHRKNVKRIFSGVLAAILVLGLVPAGGLALAARAEETECTHHPEHTEDCGYIAAQAGVSCDRNCTDTDGDGVIDHVEDCAYTPATEGQPCGYECKICAVQELIDALPEPVTEDNAETVKAQLDAIDKAMAELKVEDVNEVDATRYTMVSETLAAPPAEPGCTCTALCTENTINSECLVCGAEDADLSLCQGQADVTPPDRQDAAAVKSVQAMINALPGAEEISADNAEDVKAQLEAIDTAKMALTDEERDALDITRYNDAVSALNALSDMPGADEPALLADGDITLDISQGNINITSTGYSVNGGEEMEHAGGYIITGTASGRTITIVAQGAVNLTFSSLTMHSTSNLNIQSGTVKVELNGVNLIQANQDGGGNAVNMADGAQLHFYDSDDSGGSIKLHGASNYWGGGAAVSGGNLYVYGGTVSLIGGNKIYGLYGNAFDGQSVTVAGGTLNCYKGVVDSTTGGNVTVAKSFAVEENAEFIILNDTTLTISESAVLNNNGTISGSGKIANNGTIISNGTISGNGVIQNNSTIFKNGDINFNINGNGTVIQNNTVGAFKVTGDPSKYTYADEDNVLTILDGAELTITMADSVTTTTTDTILVASGANANITLNGVNIDVSSGAAFKIADDSIGNVTIILADGSINTLKSGTNCAGLQKNGTGNDIGVLTITGAAAGTGVLNAIGGSSGAGIGSGRGASGSSTTTSSAIIINGGTVIATGGENGAGIGGGWNGHGENITISGGTVTAKGGTKAAGIGGGDTGPGGTVTINGGTVYASGGTAGIGGGSGGSRGTFYANGNAVIFASSISDQSGKENNAWSGVIFEGDNGEVYGTPTVSFTIPSGKDLLIPKDSTLNANVVNNGNIYVDGTLNGTISGNGSVFYLLTVNDGTSKGTYNYNNKTYGKVGDSITLTPDSPQVGMTFDGWQASVNGVTVGNGTFTMPASALTVTAKWEAATYVVTLNTNGGTINSGNVTAYTYGKGATLPTANDLTYAGYTFMGWYDNESFSGNPVTEISSTDTGEKEFFAKWELSSTPIIPGDTVRYIVEHYKADASSSTGYTLAETEYLAGKIGDTVTAVPKTYGGFTYNAGKSTASGTLTAITSADDILTLTLYYDETLYSVTVRNDGNGTASASAVSAKAGTKITLTATPDKGYRFKEWQVTPDSVTVEDGKFTMPAGNVTVTAVFEAYATYTLHFDANWGRKAPADQTVETTTGTGTIVITKSKPTRSGYDFKGWSTTRRGSVEYRPGNTITLSGDTTLYAVWVRSNGSAETGDSSHIQLWLTVMVLAFGGLAGTVLCFRKKRHSK